MITHQVRKEHNTLKEYMAYIGDRIKEGQVRWFGHSNIEHQMPQNRSVTS